MSRRWLVIALAGLLVACGKNKDQEPQKSEKAAAAKGDDDGPSAGAPGVTLKKGDQVRAGIKTDELELQAVAVETVAYGRLEEDPAFGFVVRAPYSGTLRAATWPVPGQQLTAGTRLATLEPRLALTDRISMNTQLASARAELNAASEAVKAAQAALNRAVALNADNKNVSDRVVEEARARVMAEQVRANGSQSLIQAIEGTLAQSTASDAQAIKLARGGTVLEVLAQPGESVEQGAPLLRLGQPEQLLARIEIPVGEMVPGNGSIRVVPAGHEAQPALAAEKVGMAAANAATQGVALMYRLKQAGPDLRPGNAVTAYIAQGGTGGKQLVIPRVAVVQQEGRAWVYVQTSDEHFERRPVPLDHPAGNGYIVSRGFDDATRLW